MYEQEAPTSNAAKAGKLCATFINDALLHCICSGNIYNIMGAWQRFSVAQMILHHLSHIKSKSKSNENGDWEKWENWEKWEKWEPPVWMPRHYLTWVAWNSSWNGDLRD